MSDSAPITNSPASPDLRLRRVALAAALGVKPWFVSAMVAAKFPMPGKTATVADAQRWLKAHPDFVGSKALKERTDYLRAMKAEAEKTKRLESECGSAAPAGRPRASVGKCGEPLLTHG